MERRLALLMLAAVPLGLPPLDVPKDNPVTPEKVALGDKLYNDERFSSTGKVACATCHVPSKGFTDSPLKTSAGINGLTGTRNAPTTLNSAYGTSQFWDGRSPDLEDQSRHPFINSIEMGLKDHEPILKIVRSDPEYVAAFKKAFSKSGKQVTMKEVTQAIASFERTLLSGNSRFDRWYFKGEATLNEAEIRGFNAFLGNGRCVSCHVVEHTSALFTDNRFHNIGVGINKLPLEEVNHLAGSFIKTLHTREQVDEKVLKDAKVSEVGRVAVTKGLTEVGAFKTPTLRNVELTAPYMHDGSLTTLEDVVEHYNRGGASTDNEVINPFLSGGIRPLNLTDREKADLVAFMKALNGTHPTQTQFSKKGD